MITLFTACILTGCTTSLPVIVSNDPIRSYLTPKTRKVNKPDVACYIEGVFYQSCPR